MLVVSRRKDESIIVTVPPSDKPTRVEVKCVRTASDRARIGIEAPREVAANRKEVQDIVDQQQAPATKVKP